MKSDLKKSKVDFCVAMLNNLKKSIVAGDNEALCKIIKSNINTDEHNNSVIKMAVKALDECIKYLSEFKEGIQE